MMATFESRARDGGARTGVVTTSHGTFETPCFMPVGTRGAVKHLSSVDLADLGAQVVLANTYHLMLRPGVDVVAALGGLHRFTGWNGHLLTDSGGYQIFSLEPRVDDEGAVFRSTYDGSSHRLTPESAADVQAAIGADIQMVLDVCPALPAEPDALRAAVDRTLDWAERGRRRFLDHDDAPGRQAQFGIVQGGTDIELRRRAAERTVEIGFDGYAIGGLSVGEQRDLMLPAVAATTELLPAEQPRYFMGLGDPVGIVEAVARGVDMFDCVLPTRLARHGTLLTSQGRLNLRRAEFGRDDGPLDPGFAASPANGWSRGYLRHLLQVGEPTAARICTLHNVAWLFDLMERTRRAIAAGTFDALRAEINATWA
ncbi:MAG: tRNA guanosine(34) transglycosylase Tgt [Acidimicrobiia bacterium]|nr:tRNA guanosine(34) transglycosylase Tgt [Acidimicrobiia bacterium]